MRSDLSLPLYSLFSNSHLIAQFLNSNLLTVILMLHFQLCQCVCVCVNGEGKMRKQLGKKGKQLIYRHFYPPHYMNFPSYSALSLHHTVGNMLQQHLLQT